MNWNQALFFSFKGRGGCAIKKMSRSNLSSRRRGGAKRKPDRAQPQEKFGEIFRPEGSSRTDHPVRALSNGAIFLMARPPLLCKEGNGVDKSSGDGVTSEIWRETWSTV